MMKDWTGCPYLVFTRNTMVPIDIQVFLLYKSITLGSYYLQFQLMIHGSQNLVFPIYLSTLDTSIILPFDLLFFHK